MKHPKLEIQKKQEQFLKNCSDEERELHARFFEIGNALYAYHEEAGKVKPADLKFYYEEWLQGLPPNIAADMRKKGLEECTTFLPFTRYINERRDIGLRDWMKEHLSPENYEYYLKSEEQTIDVL